MSELRVQGARLHGLAQTMSDGWALVGGMFLLAVVAINVVSIIGFALFGWAVPGDFEMTEMGVAIAAFSFLPFCQIRGFNVTADIFTQKASDSVLALFRFLAALVAFGFALLMVWSTYHGMLDQKQYEYTTAILQIPKWWGFAFALLSFMLLVLSSFATLVDTMTGNTGR